MMSRPLASAHPTYTVTPDSGKHIVSVKLDGVALTVTDASNAESYVFGTTSGVAALAEWAKQEP
jgi:hypothetical protein